MMVKKIHHLGYGKKTFSRRPEDFCVQSQNFQLAKNDTSPYKFAYSRTALKYGLKTAGIGHGDNVLIPGFICESAIEPLKVLGIEAVYYDVDDQLRPDWHMLDSLVNASTKAFMIVHYFGQPQNVDDCLQFSRKHSILLIEDNAHGFGGRIGDTTLGCFGHIGFSSPRKSFAIKNGAYLYLSDAYKMDVSDLKYPFHHVFSKNAEKASWVKKTYVFSYIKQQKRMMSEYVKRKGPCPLYNSQSAFRDLPIEQNYGMDEKNVAFIENQDLPSIKSLRQEIYGIWYDFAEKNGLRPVFPELHEGAVPLVFPSYADSAEESMKWYMRGHRMGIDIHSWPTLPECIVEKDGKEMRLWEKLVCFPIHQKMDVFLLKQRINIL